MEKNIGKSTLARKVTFFMICCLFSISSLAQRVTLKSQTTTIAQAMAQIEHQTGYKFFYDNSQINTNRTVKTGMNNETLTKALNKLFGGTDISYKIVDKTIALTKKKASSSDNANQPSKSSTNRKQKLAGKVLDNNGEPVIGATVMENGTTNGTVTDIDGNFDIDVAAGSAVKVSYIGYITQTIKATNKPVTIRLAEDRNDLKEIVVVGYGTMKKSDLTGSTANIKTEALTSNVTGNALESLQGKVSGVAVFNNNKPGSSPSIRVRGSGSISASNEPLYVVDGFPLMDGDLSAINPSDIESMEILKDASSTAIYGSRGANGVVMITTKSGKEGTKHLSVNASLGVQMPGRLLNTVRGQDFIDFINAAYTNAGSKSPFADNTPSYAGYNWEKELMKSSSLLQNYTVTFDGSSKGTSYMMSGGYYKQDGLIPTQDYEKVTYHTNLNHKFNSWLNVGASLQYTYSIRNDQDNAMENVSRFGWATDSPYDEDGNPVIESNPLVTIAWNPLLDYPNTTDQTTTNRVLLTAFADVHILKNLTYKLSIGQDIHNSRGYTFSNSQVPSILSAGGKGSGSNSMNKQRSKLMENILSYSNEWDKHRFTATGVYSWQDYVYENIGASGSGFVMDQTGAWDMSLADRNSLTVSSTKYSNRLISFTGRVTYAYADKYLFTTTARWDGSSRFGEDKKWGFFPSVGLAWRASEEAFLKDNKVISNLKVRGSFGVTGNQEIGNYNSLPRLTSSNYTDGSGDNLQGYKETIGNPSLQWEKTNQYDLGLDLGLFNRVNINIDYYKRDTKDLLYNVPIPSTSGYSSILTNIGEVENHGLEFSLSAVILKNKDWEVNASLNYSYNTNKIKKLYRDVDRILVGSNGTTGLNRELRVGKPVDGVYARHSLGIIKTQEQLEAYKKAVPSTAANAQLGDEMYEDINGDGQITTDDYICIGSVQPKHYYGFNVNVSFRDFSLNIYGQGANKYASMAGAEAFYVDGSSWTLGYGSTAGYFMTGENQIQNNLYFPTSYAYKRMWSTSNPNGTFPAPGAHDVWLSDRTNGNWNYFILKNIILSYNMTKLINKRTVRSVDVSLNFQNFVTFANHRGYNPVNGDISNPWAKAIILGFNVKL